MSHHLFKCPGLLLLIVLQFTTAPCQGQDRRIIQLGAEIDVAERSEKQGKHREAIAAYGRARTLATQIFGTNHINVAALAQGEGLLHRTIGDYAKAEALIGEGLRIGEAVRDDEFVAEAVNNLAAVKWEQALYLEAQTLHERALTLLIRRYGENSAQAAVSRNNLAGTYKSLGETSRAEPLFLQSIKTLRNYQPKHALELADALMNLADLYTTQGQFPRSELMLLEAIEIKKKAFGENHYEVGRTLNNLAGLYSSMGQYAKAEELQKRALKLLETGLGADSPDVARSLTNLAIDYQRQQRFDEAEPLYKRALATKVKVVGPEHPDTALAQHNLGGFYTDRGDNEKALASYQESLANRSKSLGADHPTVAYSLMAIGEVQRRMGLLEDARKNFEEALLIRRTKLTVNHPDLAYTYSALAFLDAATERWSASAENFELARRGFRLHIDQVLPSLAESDQLAFLKHSDEPHYHAALSLVLANPTNDTITERSAGWVLNGKAISLQALSQRALVARDTNNPQLEAVVKSLLLIRKQLASLMLTSDTTEADSKRQSRINELVQHEMAQSQQLAREGGTALGSANWLELDAFRKSLKPDTVVIEIARFTRHDYSASDVDNKDAPQRYVAWIIPSADVGKIKTVDLGEASKVDELVRTARAALQSAPATIREHGEPEAEKMLVPVMKELAQQVLYPLLSSMKPDQTIYLSPDSMLWLVPWSALPLENGEYAIEKYDIRFLVSGRDLARSEAQVLTGPPIIFADPDFNLDPAAVQSAAQQVLSKAPGNKQAVRALAPAGKSKLGTAARLPGTKSEAEAVLPQLEKFSAQKATVYSGRWALEAIFKELHQPRVLVLSTHGFFQEEKSEPDAAAKSNAPPNSNPLLRCGLLLAGCNKPVDTSVADGEDGILTGLEIVSADLRGTELVVLSACETGLGEVRNGQGVAGLRQAFQLAGARSVISTLWQIPDRETAKLMASFFAGLADSGDKARALRDSQLKLINSRRDRNGAAHPFFWAAFTITGQ